MWPGHRDRRNFGTVIRFYHGSPTCGGRDCPQQPSQRPSYASWWPALLHAVSTQVTTPFFHRSCSARSRRRRWTWMPATGACTCTWPTVPRTAPSSPAALGPKWRCTAICSSQLRCVFLCRCLARVASVHTSTAHTFLDLQLFRCRQSETHKNVKRCATRQSRRRTIDGSARRQLQNRRTRHQTHTSGSCCRISRPEASEQPPVWQQQLHKSTLARAETSRSGSAAAGG